MEFYPWINNEMCDESTFQIKKLCKFMNTSKCKQYKSRKNVPNQYVFRVILLEE